MTKKYACPYCGKFHPASDLIACQRLCTTCGQPPIDWSQVGIYDAITESLHRNGIDLPQLASDLTVAVYTELGLLP